MSSCFERRNKARQKDDGVESGCVASSCGHAEVTEMNRIERTAEKGNFFPFGLLLRIHFRQSNARIAPLTNCDTVLSMPKKRLSWIPRPHISRRKRNVGAPPGSLVHVGEKRTERTEIRLVSYDGDSVEMEDLETFPSKKRCDDPDKVVWLHTAGLHEVEKLSVAGKEFGISNLILEDILNTGSRPKIEKRADEIFVVTKLVTVDHETRSVDIQHFALLLLPGNLLLTFVEGPSDAFDPVIDRIRTGGGGRIRVFGADYLAWAILDATVDHYLSVIDHLDESVGEMDDRLQVDSSGVEASELYNLKRDVGHLYRAIRPIREITVSLTRPNTPLLEERSQAFFEDLNDHGIQVLESTEDLRENVSSLRDFYLSAVSNRMNEVMKVLTCFSTIFLPLTFIAGVYGMNFEHIPELKLEWGYPAVWLAFILCAAGMFLLFRKKNWL